MARNKRIVKSKNNNSSGIETVKGGRIAKKPTQNIDIKKASKAKVKLLSTQASSKGNSKNPTLLIKKKKSEGKPATKQENINKSSSASNKIGTRGKKRSYAELAKGTVATDESSQLKKPKNSKQETVALRGSRNKKPTDKGSEWLSSIKSKKKITEKTPSKSRTPRTKSETPRSARKSIPSKASASKVSLKTKASKEIAKDVSSKKPSKDVKKALQKNNTSKGTPLKSPRTKTQRKSESSTPKKRSTPAAQKPKSGKRDKSPKNDSVTKATPKNKKPTKTTKKTSLSQVKVSDGHNLCAKSPHVAIEILQDIITSVVKPQDSSVFEPEIEDDSHPKNDVESVAPIEGEKSECSFSEPQNQKNTEYLKEMDTNITQLENGQNQSSDGKPLNRENTDSQNDMDINVVPIEGEKNECLVSEPKTENNTKCKNEKENTINNALVECDLENTDSNQQEDMSSAKEKSGMHKSVEIDKSAEDENLVDTKKSSETPKNNSNIVVLGAAEEKNMCSPNKELDKIKENLSVSEEGTESCIKNLIDPTEGKPTTVLSDGNRLKLENGVEEVKDFVQDPSEEQPAKIINQSDIKASQVGSVSQENEIKCILDLPQSITNGVSEGDKEEKEAYFSVSESIETDKINVNEKLIPSEMMSTASSKESDVQQPDPNKTSHESNDKSDKILTPDKNQLSKEKCDASDKKQDNLKLNKEITKEGTLEIKNNHDIHEESTNGREVKNNVELKEVSKSPECTKKEDSFTLQLDCSNEIEDHNESEFSQNLDKHKGVNIMCTDEECSTNDEGNVVIEQEQNMKQIEKTDILNDETNLEKESPIEFAKSSSIDVVSTIAVKATENSCTESEVEKPSLLECNEAQNIHSDNVENKLNLNENNQTVSEPKHSIVQEIKEDDKDEKIQLNDNYVVAEDKAGGHLSVENGTKCIPDDSSCFKNDECEQAIQKMDVAENSPQVVDGDCESMVISNSESRSSNRMSVDEENSPMDLGTEDTAHNGDLGTNLQRIDSEIMEIS